MRFRSSIIIFFLLEFLVYSNAQTVLPDDRQGIRFNNLTTENGLCNNIIYSILQDSSGYIWFGTFNGLLRYDGNTFERFIHKSHDSNSIADNQITCTCEDIRHNIWIGTGFGLSCFNPITQKFTNHYFDKWLAASGNNHIVALDADRNGTLWISTYTKLYKLNILSGECTTLKTRNGISHGNFVRGICSTKQGRLFVAFDTTLQYSDDTGKTFKIALCLDYSKQSTFTSLSIDKNEHLWAGNEGYPVVYEINAHTLEVRQHIFDTEKHINKDSNNIAFATRLLNDSILMIGAVMVRYYPQSTVGGGFYVLNIKNDKYVKYTFIKNNPNSIISNYIFCIYSDRQQTVWLGTANGVSYFNFKELNFHQLQFPPKLDSSVFEAGIQDIKQDNNGTLWVSTYDNHLISYNTSEYKFSMFSLKNEFKSPYSIGSIYPSGDSVLISSNKGIKLYDTTHKMFLPSSMLPASFETLGKYPIIHILKDKLNTFWFATLNFGVFKYSAVTQEIKQYLAPTSANNTIPATTFLIGGFAQDADGNVWVGTSDKGFCCLHPLTGKIDWNYPGNNQTEEKSWGFVTDIFCDTNGFVYLSTARKGLLEYNSRKGILINYTTENGLANDRVYKIISGRNKYLWLATEKGLSCFDKTAKKFHNYFKANGLISDVFSPGGCAVNSGTIFLNCGNIVEYFDPSSILLDTIGIYPEFISMQVNNKDYNHDLSQIISLGYNYNTISFSFSAFDFINSREDNYAYKLEGLDADWNYCGNRRYAEYTNLRGGDYILRLKVENSNGIWVESARPIIMHIATPFWKTWWFIILCNIAIFGLGYLFYYLRIQHELESERLRARLARDLHDDVGSSLSSISIISSMASKKAKQTPEEVMRILTKISETSQKTLDSISDIVWTVNPKNDLMEDLFMRMRLHTSEILETQSISYEFNADRETENIKMTMERRKNIYLIFKESVNNIAKYSKCTHVLINAELNNGNVELEITDNGIGFHEGDVADSGNGLKNMKLRASQIKGKISIESKPGEGTTIRLIFPYT